MTNRLSDSKFPWADRCPKSNRNTNQTTYVNPRQDSNVSNRIVRSDLEIIGLRSVVISTFKAKHISLFPWRINEPTVLDIELDKNIRYVRFLIPMIEF